MDLSVSRERQIYGILERARLCLGSSDVFRNYLYDLANFSLDLTNLGGFQKKHAPEIQECVFLRSAKRHKDANWAYQVQSNNCQQHIRASDIQRLIS